MKFLFYLFLAALPALGAMANPLIVQLPNERIALEYPLPVRLDQVLADAAKNLKSNSPSSYPISNQLFNLSKSIEAQEDKLSVLKTLSELQAPSGLRVSSEILFEQVKRWDIGYREFLPLDLDLVRDHPELNPRLLGEYELLIPSRKNVIIIEGLLFKPRVVEFSSAHKLSELLDHAQTLSTASNSYAWIIYPDGHYERFGYAYWNNQNPNLVPGSVVFVGFKSEAPELMELERKIVKLISMRKKI